MSNIPIYFGYGVESLENLIGKIEVAPTPQAKLVFDLIKLNPDLYKLEFQTAPIPETDQHVIISMKIIQVYNREPKNGQNKD